MSDEGMREREHWKAALAPAPGCLALEDLSAFSDGALSGPARARVSSHLAGCLRCRTELAMLQEFEAAAPRPGEEAAVDWVTARLESRFPQIVGTSARPTVAPLPAINLGTIPWWQRILRPRAASAAALAFATVLIVIAGSLYVRTPREPALSPPTETGPVVLRSEELVLLSPAGDLEQAPTELRWQAAASAVAYSVELMEVDHAKLWAAEATGTTVVLPASVRSKIVPGKTLLWQVTALDAPGHPVATSQIQRFRVSSSPQPLH